MLQNYEEFNCGKSIAVLNGNELVAKPKKNGPCPIGTPQEGKRAMWERLLQAKQPSRILENVLTLSSILVNIMIICGLDEDKSILSLDSIIYTFLHYDVITDCPSGKPRKQIRKTDLFADLQWDCNMNRCEAKLAYAIIKYAFRAFYYKQLTNQYDHTFYDEYVWGEAARKTTCAFTKSGASTYDISIADKKIRCAYIKYMDMLTSILKKKNEKGVCGTTRSIDSCHDFIPLVDYAKSKREEIGRALLRYTPSGDRLALKKYCSQKFAKKAQRNQSGERSKKPGRICQKKTGAGGGAAGTGKSGGGSGKGGKRTPTPSGTKNKNKLLKSTKNQKGGDDSGDESIDKKRKKKAKHSDDESDDETTKSNKSKSSKSNDKKGGKKSNRRDQNETDDDYDDRRNGGKKKSNKNKKFYSDDEDSDDKSSRKKSNKANRYDSSDDDRSRSKKSDKKSRKSRDDDSESDDRSKKSKKKYDSDDSDRGRSKKKSSKRYKDDSDEDTKSRKNKKSARDDSEDDSRSRKNRKNDRDDSDDDRRKKKSARDDSDDDDRRKKKSARDGDSDDDDRRKKKSARDDSDDDRKRKKEGKSAREESDNDWGGGGGGGKSNVMSKNKNPDQDSDDPNYKKSKDSKNDKPKSKKFSNEDDEKLSDQEIAILIKTNKNCSKLEINLRGFETPRNCFKKIRSMKIQTNNSSPLDFYCTQVE